MTGLREWFRDSKSGGTFMREEGLTPSRHSFENGTNYTRVIFQIKQACFYLPIFNQHDMHNLLRISKLFYLQSFSVRNGRKVTPI